VAGPRKPQAGIIRTARNPSSPRPMAVHKPLPWDSACCLTIRDSTEGEIRRLPPGHSKPQLPDRDLASVVESETRACLRKLMAAAELVIVSSSRLYGLSSP
jgi:hypothetical protein